MSKHLIVGAGPVGSAAARLLADRGEEVVVVTRTGAAAGPLDGVRRLHLDAADTAALTAAAEGATALYNCANPPYHRWAEVWPPLAASLLTAAERTGAVLATVSNLYGYGAVDGPMGPDSPLRPNSVKGGVRAAMWREALAAHRDGRVRATEVRGSDYLGPGVTAALDGRAFGRALAGRTVQVLGDPDAPHSWTSPADAARLLVTAAAEERAWGRAWHVPSNPPRSQRQVVADLCAAAGRPAPKVTAIPGPVLALLGLVNPTVRAVRETAYQFERPFVIDDTATREAFGLEPRPWERIVAELLP
ncbi:MULTISPECIES: NAD-dependent epimerase/dehydratase family protein [Kitasatospora]|uniref:NAD-dependent epimerase/dehydratase family protein n=1 Tax=Kitasatospora TaxID=2063 RepID=UPI0004C37217|nr:MULTISPECIES: NAD-dependent epimerase/dehydratase family protein [unclassified Kitasatospora]WAL73738.1 NAD-dependent epimerase/dehydratase family protein [Kitasatospora sp. YST-16]WNW39806.1 NAD-dependent epimerase/dehydratase family protein [Streptomyces sp. Li-HN-5-13]